MAGDKGCATKKKKESAEKMFFCWNPFPAILRRKKKKKKKVHMATKPRGGQRPVTGPLRKKLFCGFPRPCHENNKSPFKR